MDTLIDRIWEDDVLPAMAEYVRIPALSPAYDPEWEPAGHITAAASLLGEWCRGRALPGWDGGGVEIAELPGHTPLLWVEVPATEGAPEGTVLVYGHLDKQPPMGA